jgi:hypothetical protein
MDFTGSYTYYASSVHEGVSVTIDMELKQEGNIVKGRIYSRGNFYYEPNPTDGFSYKLSGTIDPANPDRLTLQFENGKIEVWFEAGKYFVKFRGAPQEYAKIL